MSNSACCFPHARYQHDKCFYALRRTLIGHEKFVRNRSLNLYFFNIGTSRMSEQMLLRFPPRSLIIQNERTLNLFLASVDWRSIDNAAFQFRFLLRIQLVHPSCASQIRPGPRSSRRPRKTRISSELAKCRNNLNLFPRQVHTPNISFSPRGSALKELVAGEIFHGVIGRRILLELLKQHLRRMEGSKACNMHDHRLI